MRDCLADFAGAQKDESRHVVIPGEDGSGWPDSRRSD